MIQEDKQTASPQMAEQNRVEDEAGLVGDPSGFMQGVENAAKTRPELRAFLDRRNNPQPPFTDEEWRLGLAQLDLLRPEIIDEHCGQYVAFDIHTGFYVIARTSLLARYEFEKKYVIARAGA